MSYKGKGSSYKGKGSSYKGKGSSYKGKGSSYKGKGSSYKGKGAPVPEPVDDKKCSAHPSCAHLHGDCCPTASGIYLYWYVYMRLRVSHRKYCNLTGLLN